MVAQNFFLNAEHQSSTYGYVLSPRLGSMHRWLLCSKSAGLLIIPLLLESGKSARTEPRPTVRRRMIQKPILTDGGRGETISFGWNDCRRLARRRYLLGPSIRCGAVVPARQLSKYYNLRAGHSVEAKKIVPPNPVLSLCRLVTCNLNKQPLCGQRQPIAFVLRTHLLGRFRVRPVTQSASRLGQVCKVKPSIY